jgi:hypothetical protein
MISVEFSHQSQSFVLYPSREIAFAACRYSNEIAFFFFASLSAAAIFHIQSTPYPQLTLLGSTVQDGRSPHKLLQNLIALLKVGVALGLFLLADRLKERGDLGLEAALFAEGVDVLGELVGELGERTLNEEGVGRSGHDWEGVCGGRRRGGGKKDRFFDGGVVSIS